MKRNILSWHYDAEAQLWALSAIGDGEDSFVWRINVTEPGFTIEKTDQELKDGCGHIPDAFLSVRRAKQFCEENELAARAAYMPYTEEQA